MNRLNNITKPLMWLMALVLTAFIAGCGGGSSSSTPVPDLLNSAKSIDTFSLAWSTPSGTATGTIDETLKTIKVTVPHATLLNQMVAKFTASPGVSVTVGTVLQVSESTQNDYTLPLSYKVTAADGTWVTYTVIVSRDPTVTSLAVTPATGASTPKGATYQFMATATYLDASTEDVTTTASWTSGSANATVGLHTGLAVGVNTTVGTPVVITAAYGGQTATAQLAVTSAALVSLDIAPASGVVAVGSNLQFAATGTYTDTLTHGVTPIWTSSASGVASIDTNGLATGVNVGTTNITAALSGVTSPAAVLTVTAPPGPNLRTAASFAVLAGTTLTNSGATTINTGNVGATGETISGTLTLSSGTNYPIGSETTYVTAKSDMAAAITAANDPGQFPCGVGATYNISGAMGTASRAPGTYCINTNAAISGVVNLTLNAPGIYIFRTAGALTPAAGSTVAFGGTATSANTTVFWVVGSASLGTPGTTWKGTILTPGAVTLGDGTTLINGRVLSNAAVILTNNTITKP